MEIADGATTPGNSNKPEQCLRLFFSVDVSGSTEYKNKHSDFTNYDRHWTRFYGKFFDDFPVLFANKVAAQFQDSPRRCPEVWKCLGDEIIYEDKVESDSECHRLITAFYEAIIDYDLELRTDAKYKDTGLRVKGTCWTAGFPVRNTKLLVPGTGNNSVADYIGPDLDIGFRLAKVTRPGRVVISMDLADILTQRNTHTPSLAFYHVGWKVLEGVFGDKPYPIVWIVSQNRMPHILPWEDHLCEFTKSFNENNGGISSGELQAKIVSIRNSLPQLRLITPYFKSSEMPEEHRKFWENWEKQFERDCNQDVNMTEGAKG